MILPFSKQTPCERLLLALVIFILSSASATTYQTVYQRSASLYLQPGSSFWYILLLCGISLQREVTRMIIGQSLLHEWHHGCRSRNRMVLEILYTRCSKSHSSCSMPGQDSWLRVGILHRGENGGSARGSLHARAALQTAYTHTHTKPVCGVTSLPWRRVVSLPCIRYRIKAADCSLLRGDGQIAALSSNSPNSTWTVTSFLAPGFTWRFIRFRD